MSHEWLYKDSIENGVRVLLEEVAQYKKDGWVDPADLGKETIYIHGESTTEVEGEAFEKMVAKNLLDENVDSLSDLSKEDLELYAREMFNVELDRRKSKANLIKEIEALEAK